MSAPKIHDLTDDHAIRRGITFREVVTWETPPWRSVRIAAIQNEPSTRIVTQEPHGLTPGWRVAVVGARGLEKFNVRGETPTAAELRRITVIDPTTVAFDGVSAVDCGHHRPNTGWLQWYSPHDMLGYAARMAIRRRAGGELLHLMTSGIDAGIVIDDSLKTITLQIDAGTTELFDWRAGVYDLELESPEGDVFAILAGCVSVVQEITSTTP